MTAPRPASTGKAWRPPAVFANLSGRTVVVELVAGTHDGERDAMPPADDGKPAETITKCAEVYVRRADLERCTVDDLQAWHYDVERPVPA